VNLRYLIYKIKRKDNVNKWWGNGSGFRKAYRPPAGEVCQVKRARRAPSSSAVQGTAHVTLLSTSCVFALLKVAEGDS
jgi:hypothetical protein